MFVAVDHKEAAKHVGKFACIKTVKGKIEFKGKLEDNEDCGTVIKFGKGDPDTKATENDPSFLELHPLIIGEQQILIWAAPGEPNYGLLEAVKQEDPLPNNPSEVGASGSVQSTESDNNGVQTSGEAESTAAVGSESAEGSGTNEKLDADQSVSDEDDDKGYF
jgi:hypothetical protein